MSFANERIIPAVPMRVRYNYFGEFPYIILSVSLNKFLGDFFMFNLLAVSAFDFSAIFGNIVKRWYYYLALLIFLALVIIYTVLRKNKRNSLSRTQKLVYTAMFSALAFIANYFTIKASDVFQLSFVSLVGFVAGYSLGAGLGFTASFIGDLICGIVAPFGAYNPIIGIGTGLWGFVPGVIFASLPINDYFKTALSFVICFFLNSFVVNTFGLSVMYSMSFESLLILLPGKLAVVAVNCAIAMFFTYLLPKILPKDKFHLNKQTNE